MAYTRDELAQTPEFKAVGKTLHASVLAHQRLDALTGRHSTATAEQIAQAQADADAAGAAYVAAHDAYSALPVVKVEPIRQCACGITGRGWHCPDCSRGEYYG